MEKTNSTTGHPKGLYLLFATEMWERFSYYGMRAIFTLYMIKALVMDKALSSALYGDYTGLVYLTPLIGGFVADRYWGNRKSIIFGGILMAIGQFFMFMSALNYSNAGFATSMMFIGLAFLIVGNGFFKPNISTMVGSLYKEGDTRVDSAFTIFYMGINAGALLAPLVCGGLGDTGNAADFKWGFLSACIGMVISLYLFITLKNKYIITPDGKAIGESPKKVEQTTDSEASSSFKQSTIMLWSVVFVVLFFLFKGYFNFDYVFSLICDCCIVFPGLILSDSSLTKVERSRIWVIYIIAFFVIFFWMAFEQAGASLTFFAEEQTDRTLFSWTVPASYFQTINPVAIVVLAPLFALMWTKLGKKNREPASPLKQAIGLFLLSVGYIVICLAVKNLAPGVRVSMFVLFSLYFIHTMGELCLSPIGLSMVVKLAPARYASLLMGVWFLSTAFANKLAGDLSAFYPENVHKELKADANDFRFYASTTDSSGKAVEIEKLIHADSNYIKQGAGKLPVWKVELASDHAEKKPELAGFAKFASNFKSDPLISALSGSKPDSVMKISLVTNNTPVVDSFLLKQALLETKRSYTAISEDGKFLFVLKEEERKNKPIIAMEKWNLNPEKPTVAGFKIEGLYEFFMLFVGISGVSSILLFFMSKTLLKMMHGLR